MLAVVSFVREHVCPHANVRARLACISCGVHVCAPRSVSEFSHSFSSTCGERRRLTVRTPNLVARPNQRDHDVSVSPFGGGDKMTMGSVACETSTRSSAGSPCSVATVNSPSPSSQSRSPPPRASPTAHSKSRSTSRCPRAPSEGRCEQCCLRRRRSTLTRR